MSTTLHRIGGAAVLAACLAPAAWAADAPAAKAAPTQLQQERRNCETGNTQQDKATCLREVGAAAQESRRGNLTTEGSVKGNAADRCQQLPAGERADCLARIKGPQASNQTVTKSGSVAGGGTLTETRTVTVGKPVVVPLTAASQPATAASRP